MTGLHQQLLDRIDAVSGPPSYPRLGKALRAVVELHKPVPRFDHTPDWLVCHGCDMDGYDAEHPPWPCSTVQAIARELGIEVPQ